MSLFQPSGPAAELPKNTDLTARALIKRREAGAIIGAAGATIGEIRDQFAVRTGVSKDEKSAADRVISVTGSPEGISGALSRIIYLTAEEAAEGAADPATSIHSFRLLVSHGSIGVVLGKAGETIKRIQHESNTRISASRDPLPGSTERLLEIYGTPASVADAVTQIIYLLDSDPSKDAVRVIRYNPAARARDLPSRLGPSSRGSSIVRFGASSRAPGAPRERQRRSARQEQPEFDINDPANAKVTISVPSAAAGGVIGRHGSNINRIRRSTGTSIVLSDDNGDTRFATVIGPRADVAQAEADIYTAISEAARENAMKQD